MTIQYIIFLTQKLDATAQNRFQILILHPKKHIFREKIYIFYAYLLDKYPGIFYIHEVPI